MVRFVYGIFPAFIRQRELFGKYGETTFMFVALAPGYSKGQLEHELVHVRQFYRTLGLHGFLYEIVDAYRIACEFEAYRVQVKYDGQPEWIAEQIADRGGFGVTKEEALRRLQ